ncbi:hypothetical protein PHYSODRAFT_504418 [Phytophthora sojae]|uniref:Uncharacterized protein n=1 Tax=Phytophthora sojae (strain P6497) TaxID=1094619 RepID=G4ZGC7_PHYSP|nr:hypothetical protein PHYSODRAFT_504418 [Phytophthora sojae]EGZ18572.1 hypothetical protein PHYSODRAFT_504418 [Phytophthora sojae]|eukprot:XP_009527630.1 hypothetical protein PHYSODRAFT_504418 [Phytophthora sojae]
MFGAASVLCRLGLRFHCGTEFGYRIVTDFMATLAYVDHTNDSLLCSYPSDPVLALGATRVWYSACEGLSEFILPHVKRNIRLHNAGDVGVIVARIVFLLVMDATIVIEANEPFDLVRNYAEFSFMG